MKCAVFGALGRMGRLLTEEAPLFSIEITAGLDRGSPPVLPAGTDIVLDFSSPDAWKDLDTVLDCSPAGLVSGTTGLGPDALSMLRRWSLERPVFHSPNMSTGVFVLNSLVRKARDMLGEGFDLEVVEIHHRNKEDSPSGTALSLIQGMPGHRVLGRNGFTGRRPRGDIGVHSLRGGDVPGEHQVHLMGDGERLCLTHSATGRRVFALGALRAALFLIGKPPGLYGMEDMLGKGD